MSRLLIVLVTAAVLALPSGASASWAWPLHGAVTGTFRVSPAAPYAAGQRRGIDVTAPPGTTVRAACSGRVRFAGPVPRRGLAITVACGPLRATYLRLGSLRVRAGAVVAAGHALGTLGAPGRLRLGARRAGRRFGYLDPLTLLRAPRAPHAPPPVTLRAPRPPSPVAVRPAEPDGPRIPLIGWFAVALVAGGMPVGGLIRRRRGRQPVGATRGVRAARL